MLDVTEICGGTLIEHVDGNIDCTLMRSGECLGLGQEHKTRIDCWMSDHEGCFRCTVLETEGIPKTPVGYQGALDD